MQDKIDDFLKVLESERGFSVNTIFAYRNDLSQFLGFLQGDAEASLTSDDADDEDQHHRHEEDEEHVAAVAEHHPQFGTGDRQRLHAPASLLHPYTATPPATAANPASAATTGSTSAAEAPPDRSERPRRNQ